MACSGGLDSLVLLYLLRHLDFKQLSVVYIDHQLQENSDQWGLLVQQHCQLLAIPCKILKVCVAEGNVEQQARIARYQALISQLNEDDVLMTAHHQQDQAETLFLRLLSGSGVNGLQAMKKVEQRCQPFNYYLWRPILDLSRQQLQQLADRYELEYINDPMNDDEDYHRVWCRKKVWPILEQRFPKMQEAFTRTASLMQDAQQILMEVATKDLESCTQPFQLDIVKWSMLSPARQRQVLSLWCQGDAQYRPSLEMLQHLQKEVIDSRPDAQAKLLMQGFYYLRYQQQVYRYPQAEFLALQQEIDHTDLFVDRQLCKFHCILGEYSLQPALQGISRDVWLDIANLRLERANGADKIKIYGRQGSKNLKKFCQEQQIAPWLRHRLLFLYYKNCMLAVLFEDRFYLCQSDYVQANGYILQAINIS